MVCCDNCEHWVHARCDAIRYHSQKLLTFNLEFLKEKRGIKLKSVSMLGITLFHLLKLLCKPMCFALVGNQDYCD